MTSARLALTAATAAFSARLGSLGAPQTPTFPSGVELVRIDVVVVEKDGKPVTGLTAADFEITEGGKRHEIASFEPVVVRSTQKPSAPGPAEPPHVSSSVVPVPEENRYFLIFFDDTHVRAANTEPVRVQLISFLESETHEGDWVTLVSPLAGLRWTARTPFERQQLPSVIHGLRGELVRKLRRDDPSDYEAMRMSEYAGREHREPAGPGASASGAGTTPEMLAEEVYAVAKRRVRGTLRGLSDAITSMAGFKGRKSLIAYSEGFMKSPSLPDYDRVVEVAGRVGVAVRVIDPRGLGTGRPLPDGDDGGPTLLLLDTQAAGSTYVAQATGGRVSMSNDLATPLREAAVEASAYYLIGFQPSPGRPGERKLKVRVRGDGLKVRAPDHYFVGDPVPAAKPAPPAVRALGQVADATDIPLRVATLFLDMAPDGQPITTLAVELPSVPGEVGERRLTLLVEARPAGKGEPVHDTADLTLPSGGKPGVATRELRLHAGIWQARVVVRDARTEKLGSVLHSFEVPEANGLRVSSPILGHALEGSRVPTVRLELDRRYRRGGAIYCQYHVFGAALDPTSHRPNVAGSYTVLRDGRPVLEGPPSPIEPAKDGRVQRLIGFGLADFQPGDYTLVLHVIDQSGGQRREVLEPFSVYE